MKFVIDRIEEDKLILEDENKKMVEFTMTDMKIVKDFKEGDVIEMNIDGTITLLEEETKKRKKEIEEKTKNLWE